MLFTDANRDEVIQISVQGEPCSVIGGGCSGCSPIITDESCVEVERDVTLKRGHPAEQTTMRMSRNGSCSSYFLNRGTRTRYARIAVLPTSAKVNAPLVVFCRTYLPFFASIFVCSFSCILTPLSTLGTMKVDINFSSEVDVMHKVRKVG